VTDSDEELVRRYLQGDKEAFSTLVKRHETRVYNVCLRILGNREDARDATQDAFLTALRKLSQFRGEAAFTTWLHRVAVNACYDALRKRKRQPMLRLAADDDHQREVEPGPTIPDPADALAAGIDVARALSQVPEDYRIALVLADVQDLPYEDIARVLGVPLGTVKSRVHRGRIALARALGLDAGPKGTATPAEPGRTLEPDGTLPTSEEER
jgi:RNA polymerase sigma-70 factor (ECF subfamily)